MNKEEAIRRLGRARGMYLHPERTPDDARQAQAIDLAIAALSAPQAETDGLDMNDEHGGDAIPHMRMPRWTRKDGSTTPVRGDVVDRRKNATAASGKGVRRVTADPLGRRSGDAARWTAPVQEPCKHGTWSAQTVYRDSACLKCGALRLDVDAAFRAAVWPEWPTAPVQETEQTLGSIDELTATRLWEKAYSPPMNYSRPATMWDVQLALRSLSKVIVKVHADSNLNYQELDRRSASK